MPKKNVAAKKIRDEAGRKKAACLLMTSRSVCKSQGYKSQRLPQKGTKNAIRRKHSEQAHANANNKASFAVVDDTPFPADSVFSDLLFLFFYFDVVCLLDKMVH